MLNTELDTIDCFDAENLRLLSINQDFTVGRRIAERRMIEFRTKCNIVRALYYADFLRYVKELDPEQVEKQLHIVYG